jgi:hypothetical protein
MGDKSLDMDCKAQRPAIEIAAEWIATACVAGAIGFAVSALAPLGAALIAAPAAGGLAAIGALFLMARIGRAGRALDQRFTPVDFTDEADVLMLDDPVESEDVLLLDDPWPAISEDSRVVRLFAVPTTAHATIPLPAPGEMAARIENFLGVGRTDRAADAASHPAVAADASAALHAALADIRRSLRQA